MTDSWDSLVIGWGYLFISQFQLNYLKITRYLGIFGLDFESSVFLMFYSLPFSHREIMAARWFARSMSAESSWAWASRGPNVPRRSRHSSSTSLSTRSGFTKCSNFTPARRGTEIKSGAYHSWREAGGDSGSDLSGADRRGDMRRKHQFGDFADEAVVSQRGRGLVIKDWIR